MVIIDGKKFACGACVKGHRSSSCTHTNRTLIEIGKKGRPPTQCAHCRELRRTSKVHSKCMCGDKPTSTTRHLTVLPNGVDSLQGSSQIANSSHHQTLDLVNQILNPCSCSIGAECCCAASAHSSLGTRASAAAAARHVPRPAPLPTYAPEPGSSRSSCCASRRPPALSEPPPTLGLPQEIDPRSFFAPNILLPAEPVQQPVRPVDQASLDTQPTLFAPQTAGTALCFCGIHCPCPGCVLHDPLGLKFAQPAPASACPTSIRAGEGCIAGLDLPTVNGLLNLSPIAGSYAPSSPGAPIQLPGVSEAFGGGTDRQPWPSADADSSGGCCSGKATGADSGGSSR